MNIAVLGNHGPDHATEVHVAKTLRAMGHEVAQIQEDTLEPLTIEALALGAELLVYIRCWGWEPKLDVDALRRIEERGTRTLGFHLDRFAGLARAGIVDTDPMFRCEWVMTADGDFDWPAHDVNHHWLRPGVYEPECYDAEPDPEAHAGVEVAFVGSWRSYHPEWPHRSQLVARLHEWYGERFATYPAFGEPAVRGDELNRLYATVPVVVGDCAFARLDARYWSDRYAETWGRGGFLIFPKISALTVDGGVTYPCWNVGDWDGLHRTIDYYLERPEDRARIRAMIAPRVRERMTYTARLTEALEVMGLG